MKKFFTGAIFFLTMFSAAFAAETVSVPGGTGGKPIVYVSFRTSTILGKGDRAIVKVSKGKVTIPKGFENYKMICFSDSRKNVLLCQKR